MVNITAGPIMVVVVMEVIDIIVTAADMDRGNSNIMVKAEVEVMATAVI